MPEGRPTPGNLLLKPGTLWESIVARTEHALQCGALVSIPTNYELIEQSGVNFLVRVLSNLVRKDEAKQKQDKEITAGKEFNPFLPYDEDLFVADISDTHVCILNKFNVVDYHLLIITREFEEQENLLTLQDFQAMSACLAQVEGLAFYNAGKIAGASQRHKHLQLIPLPITPKGSQIPIEPLLASAKFQDSLGSVPDLPFVHALVQLDPEWFASPLTAGEKMFEYYNTLLRTVGLPDDRTSDNKKSCAYNLLATRQWMLIVPRSHESFESISVNSLGFAGTLFVRDSQQMQILKQHSPMTVLSNVAITTSKG